MFVSELKVLGFCVDLQIPVFDKIATYLGDFSFVELVLFFYIGLHRCCHEPRIQVYRPTLCFRLQVIGETPETRCRRNIPQPVRMACHSQRSTPITTTVALAFALRRLTDRSGTTAALTAA